MSEDLYCNRCNDMIVICAIHNWSIETICIIINSVKVNGTNSKYTLIYNNTGSTMKTKLLNILITLPVIVNGRKEHLAIIITEKEVIPPTIAPTHLF